MLYDEAGRRTTARKLLNADGLGDPNRVDIRFGRDADGELYVLSKGERQDLEDHGHAAVRRLRPAAAPS